MDRSTIIYPDDVFTSIQILVEMLEYRGHDASGVMHISEEEIRLLRKSKYIFRLETGIAPFTYQIIYNLSAKFKPADIKSHVQEGFKYTLFVHQERTVVDTKNIMKQCEFLKQEDIQSYQLVQLQINISKHVLQPKFELIQDEAFITGIMQDHCLRNKSQFPIILKTDPMARFINARTGNLVRITRNSVTSGEYIVYRICA